MVFLQCVDARVAEQMLVEVHEGSFGTHPNGHVMAQKRFPGCHTQRQIMVIRFLHHPETIKSDGMRRPTWSSVLCGVFKAIVVFFAFRRQASPLLLRIPQL